MVEKLVAFLLGLVGLAFLVLLAFLKLHGELAGDTRASAFLLIVGATLICVGCTWLFSKQGPHAPAHRYDYGRYLFSLRRPVEFVAAGGLMLSGIRATALLLEGADALPRTLWLVLAFAPVLIGLFALRILPPDASQSGLFPADLVSTWSASTRRTVVLLMRIGWLGYPAMLLVWPGFHDLAPWTQGVSIQFTASVLIALLYASQVLVLHSGKVRPVLPLSTRG
jgi:hypothetical protein